MHIAGADSWFAGLQPLFLAGAKILMLASLMDPVISKEGAHILAQEVRVRRTTRAESWELRAAAPLNCGVRCWKARRIVNRRVVKFWEKEPLVPLLALLIAPGRFLPYVAEEAFEDMQDDSGPSLGEWREGVEFWQSLTCCPECGEAEGDSWVHMAGGSVVMETHSFWCAQARAPLMLPGLPVVVADFAGCRWSVTASPPQTPPNDVDIFTPFFLIGLTWEDSCLWGESRIAVFILN